MQGRSSSRLKRVGMTCSIFVLIASAGVSPLPADKKETSDWPEITEQERNLKSVPQDPDAGAVILRSTRNGKQLKTPTRYIVNELDYHWRLKVLNDRGKRYGEVHIPTQKFSRVSGMEARTVKPDGTIVAVASDQIFEKLVQKTGGFKRTELVFNFPAIEPGAILEYRYHRHVDSVVYIEPWYFAGPEFTLLSRMSQIVHEVATYRILCDKCPSPEPDTSPWKEGKDKGKLMTVEMKDIPAYREEELMPPLADVSPRVVFSLKALGGAEWEPLNREDNLFTDWDSVAKYARYYYQRAYKVDDVAVKQVVGGWTKGVSDQTDKQRAIFRHVQEDFQYRRFDDVIAYTRSIAEILKDKTADNEEKAVLLLAALRSIGVPANIVLVVGKDRGTLYPSFFSLAQFSHVMVAVPQPDGTALWLDPTVTYSPFGFMPWKDSGAGALYITDTGSALINLPQKDEVSRTRYQVTVKARPDGKADLEVVAEYQGEDAIEKRQELVPGSETSRTEYLQKWLKDARPGAALRSHQLEDLEAIDKPLRIKMTIEAPELVTRADELLLVRGCILDCEESNPISTGERQYPFYVGREWNDEQTVTIVPPEGMKMSQLPSPASVKSAIGTLTSSCPTQTDGSVRCVRKFAATRGRWAASEQAGIRSMFDKIVEADRNTVAFDKKTQGTGSGGR